MKRVGAESTAAIFSEVSPHVNQVGSFMLQGDHVKALPNQVVARYKFSRLTLTEVSDSAGENRMRSTTEEEETQVEVGWG